MEPDNPQPKEEDPLLVWTRHLPHWNFWWEPDGKNKKWFGWVDTGPNTYTSVQGKSFLEVVSKARKAR